MTYLQACDERDAAALPRTALCDAPETQFFAPSELPDWLSSQWDALAERASEPNPFAERWFVEPGIASYGHLLRLRIAAVIEGGELIGVMPLSTRRRLNRIPLPNVGNWNQPDAFLGTPLIQPGREEAFWLALIEVLDRADWAPGFLHVIDLVEDGPVHRGLAAAARRLKRPAPVVQRTLRAFLESGQSPADYYARAVPKKKRKELKRLTTRLAEEGELVFRELEDPALLPEWSQAFLDLERAGWKGRAGSAIACYEDGGASFHASLAGAMAAGRLQMLRMDLDERPLAMLVNFLTPPGAFMFKTAYAEDYARFSPGVLLQIHNYNILDRADIAWMDSCADADHPMIDKLWEERRSIVKLSVPLAGLGRRAIFSLCRSVETAAAAAKSLRARS